MLPDLKSSASYTRSVLGSESLCRPECGSHYKGTLDVLYKIIRQVGGHVPFIIFCELQACWFVCYHHKVWSENLFVIEGL